MKQNILVIDDEVDIAELVAEHLEAHYSVITATSMKDACEKISKNKFDLIVTDLHLPDCRGESSVSLLRQTQFAEPILLVTGEDEYDPCVIKALADGAQGLIKKPFNLDSVEASIFQTLQVKRAG